MKRIAIITEAGPGLGTGHLQRMALLAHYLSEDSSYNISLVTGAPLPGELEGLRKSEIPEDSSLIIRDIRDSEIDEIEKLRKTAPVLAVDDAGPGQEKADHCLNLLPSPVETEGGTGYNPSLFLYGYAFARSLEKLENRQIPRVIDLVIYPGAHPSAETLGHYKELLPPDTSFGFFYNDRFQGTGSQPFPENFKNNFAAILLSSRVLLTYFGISLFEGRGAGCRLAVLDPGAYHNSLTRQLKWPSLYNLGTWENINVEKIETDLTMIIKNGGEAPVDPGELYREILAGCSRVKTIIEKIIS